MRPDPAGRRLVNRKFKTIQPGRLVAGGRRLQDMHSHDLFVGVVQHQADKVEWGHDGKALREIPKQRDQIAMSRDGLGYFQ